MILYFTDRQMNITGTASTSLPGSLIVSDQKTIDIDTGVASFDFTVAYEPSEQIEVTQKLSVGNYILRSHENEAEFYTIIETETDTKSNEITVSAEDAGLDLLNDVVGEYAPTQAYNIAHYINRFTSGSGFEIGVNEISNLTRKLTFEGEATACERVRSVATQFDNAEISYSFEIKGLMVTKRYINIWQKRGGENTQLRVDIDIDRLNIKTSIANLATALYCTGAIPKNKDKPITLSGYSYDDGEFYVEGGNLCSRSAFERWARFNSGTGGHIVKRFSHEAATTQASLCTRGITELKKLREPELNLDCDISRGTERFSIGDRVDIIDRKGEVYISGRALKIEESITDGTKKATFGEYLIKDSGINEKVYALAAEFSKMAKNRTLYTWFAYADDVYGNGISLSSVGKSYLGIAVNQTEAEVDISDASIFNWSAIEGSDSIHLTITSSNGVVFKNGLINTTLTAHIFKSGVELNAAAVSGIGTVKWYEVDGDEIGTGLTKNITGAEIANIIAKLEEI